MIKMDWALLVLVFIIISQNILRIINSLKFVLNSNHVDILFLRVILRNFVATSCKKDTMPLKKICPFPSTLITYRKIYIANIKSEMFERLWRLVWKFSEQEVFNCPHELFFSTNDPLQIGHQWMAIGKVIQNHTPFPWTNSLSLSESMH